MTGFVFEIVFQLIFFGFLPVFYRGNGLDCFARPRKD